MLRSSPNHAAFACADVSHGDEGLKGRLIIVATHNAIHSGRGIVDLNQCDTVRHAILDMDDENSCTRHAVRSE